MSNLDEIIFKGKTFSGLLSEIYDNQTDKKAQIAGLINQLKPLINEIGDATLLVPLIKEYMDLGIKNDDQLIKMANIVQRALNSSSGGEEDFGLSEAEKSELLGEMKKLNPGPDDI